MAEETVTAMAKSRVDTANAALYEMQLLYSLLQRHIERDDEAGTIYPVTRGAFMRLNDLATAIGQAIDPDEHPDIDEVRATVYGKGASHHD